MEYDTALAASGYLLACAGLFTVFVYLVVRLLRPVPDSTRTRTGRRPRDASRQSRYARERYEATRLQR